MRAFTEERPVEMGGSTGHQRGTKLMSQQQERKRSLGEDAGWRRWADEENLGTKKQVPGIALKSGFCYPNSGLQSQAQPYIATLSISTNHRSLL